MKKYFKEIKRKSKKIQQNKCEDEKICDKSGKNGENREKWKKITKIHENTWKNISEMIWFNQVEKESERDESSNLEWTK